MLTWLQTSVLVEEGTNGDWVSVRFGPPDWRMHPSMYPLPFQIV